MVENAPRGTGVPESRDPRHGWLGGSTCDPALGRTVRADTKRRAAAYPRRRPGCDSTGPHPDPQCPRPGIRKLHNNVAPDGPPLPPDPDAVRPPESDLHPHMTPPLPRPHRHHRRPEVPRHQRPPPKLAVQSAVTQLQPQGSPSPPHAMVDRVGESQQHSRAVGQSLKSVPHQVATAPGALPVAGNRQIRSRRQPRSTQLSRTPTTGTGLCGLAPCRQGHREQNNAHKRRSSAPQGLGQISPSMNQRLLQQSHGRPPPALRPGGCAPAVARGILKHCTSLSSMAYRRPTGQHTAPSAGSDA